MSIFFGDLKIKKQPCTLLFEHSLEHQYINSKKKKTTDVKTHKRQRYFRLDNHLRYTTQQQQQTDCTAAQFAYTV